ncbi:MAG TPA: hypothetical protein VGM82_23415 [Gemmatimonadaceae bacterium]|jgi:hypothetical protein
MNIRCLSFVVLLALVATARVAAAQGTCFGGPIRAGCSGFVVVEGNAVLSRGGPSLNTITSGSFVGVPHRDFHDLPNYISGAAGYLRGIDPRTAIGAVAEVGAGQTSDQGTRWRVAAVGRWRRQLDSHWALDAGAGPLAVQVNILKPVACCAERVTAYGGTTEAALTYRNLIAVTAGADLINGDGRTTTAGKLGVRFSSAGTVTAAVITASAIGLLVLALYGN